MGEILSMLFFYKDGFGIKEAKNVDITLNKGTRTNQSKTKIVQSDGTVEYTDSTSAEG